MEVFPRTPEDLIGDKIHKLIHNAFIGSLGTRFDSYDTGFITNDYITMCAMFNESSEGFNMLKMNDLFFVRYTKKERKFRDYSPIFRQILCQGMIQLLDMIELFYNNNITLIGYNTDSVFIKNPNNVDLTKYPFIRTDDWKPKLYRDNEVRDESIETSKFKEWNTLPDIQFRGKETYIDKKLVTDEEGTKYIEELKNKSFCCIGMAGCQKTTLATKLFVPNETKIFCFTNKACQNLIQSGLPKNDIRTFDSAFYKDESITSNIKRIMVDEFSMLPIKWMEQLYLLKKKGCFIQLYGDDDQCPQVDKRYYNYRKKKVFRHICDFNLIEKQFVEGCGRYNKNLYTALRCLKETGRLHPSLKNKNIDENIEVNITKYNHTKDEINKKFMAGRSFYKGLKIIGTKNYNKIIFNSRFYYVVDFKDDKVSVTEEEGGNPLTNNNDEAIYFPTNYFEPAFAVTCYRYQGSTIEGNYNIWDVDKMNFNELYTALSRGRKLSNVHFKYTDQYFKKVKEPLNATLRRYSRGNIGEIYLMSNEKHNVHYVGKSTTNTQQRFEEHKANKNDPMHAYDGKWTTKCISSVRYWSDELDKAETRYIRIYHEKGYKLINTYKVPKKEITYKMETGTIDERIKNKYNIEDNGNFFRIRYMDNGGKRIEIKRRYGKRKSKEEALIEINKERDNLLKLSFD